MQENSVLKDIAFMGSCAIKAQEIQAIDFSAVSTATIVLGFKDRPSVVVPVDCNAPTEFGQQLWQVFFPLLCSLVEEYHNAMLAEVEHLHGQIVL